MLELNFHGEIHLVIQPTNIYQIPIIYQASSSVSELGRASESSGRVAWEGSNTDCCLLRQKICSQV